MSNSIIEQLRGVKIRVVDQRKATISRLKGLYREDGFTEVYRGIRDYYVYHVANSSYQDSRVDNEYRWKVVQSHIAPGTELLIDIGCADGYFAEKAGELGINVLGLEHNYSRAQNTSQRLEDYPNIDIDQMTVAPENITDLPNSDVTLFLTVFHHWVWQYGWEDATEMFQTVCDRSEIVVFEPPGTYALRTDEELDPNESETYYRDVLNNVFGDSVSIIDFTMVGYSGGERSDPLFVLDTSGYSNKLEIGAE